MRGAILYKGVYLMPGSVAHKLHTEKKYKELEAHMKALDAKDKQLKGLK